MMKKVRMALEDEVAESFVGKNRQQPHQCLNFRGRRGTVSIRRDGNLLFHA